MILLYSPVSRGSEFCVGCELPLQSYLQHNGILSAMPAREMVFNSLLSGADDRYDAVIFDCAPSISSLQTCAIAYTRNVFCPVGMDHLSIEGVMGTLQVIHLLNQRQGMNCRCIGFLPTMVDRRLQ